MITCHNVFNVWPKTTLLLPVWAGDARRPDSPVTGSQHRAPFATCLLWRGRPSSPLRQVSYTCTLKLLMQNCTSVSLTRGTSYSGTGLFRAPSTLFYATWDACCTAAGNPQRMELRFQNRRGSRGEHPERRSSEAVGGTCEK